MYERSAIVLERYFENLLYHGEGNNLRINFENYADLVEKLEEYQVNYEQELIASEEFEQSVKNVREIQASQERLYKKSAKLEYNRNLLFGNIDGKMEDTIRAIEKIEADVEKNNEAMKEIRVKLQEVLSEYNEKKQNLTKCKKSKKVSENAYVESLERAQETFACITGDVVDTATEFLSFENLDDVIDSLEKNGKGEKVPFNKDVMTKATVFCLELTKKEVESYLTIYEKMCKLLIDIEDGTAKIDVYKGYLKNEKARIEFIQASKNYIVQFLDYERMIAIHGKKSHTSIMADACANFDADVNQIKNLYELLVREIAGKATKKSYKELYNKSYLIDIQEQEESFQQEKKRVKFNVGTLISTNYWRIEGITEIYTIFYNCVTEVFGRDVAEFDVPKQEVEPEIFEKAVKIELPEKMAEVEEKKSKVPFEINLQSRNKESKKVVEDIYEGEDVIDDIKEELQESFEEEFDIFGEKYQNIDFSEKTIKVKTDLQTKEEDKPKFFDFEEEQDEPVEEMKVDSNTSDEDVETTKTQSKKIKQEKVNESKVKVTKAKVKVKEQSQNLMEEIKEELKPAKVRVTKAKKVFEEEIPYDIEEDEENMLLEVKPAKTRKKTENQIEDIDFSKKEKTKPGIILKKINKVNKIMKKESKSNA